MLTRVEAEVTFRLLLQRFPQLRLGKAAVQWVANPAYRGVVALPVSAVDS